ncbi:MAG: hypothetical protein IKP50_00540 [Bacilli bacterium]|nr:hypothetical protein [Bacilli bacterium]
MLTDVVNVSYNTTTGVWTFTRRNGSTFTYDQNIEKIPASFSMDANGVITMKTADGTVYTADISSQIKPYNFDDGTIIDFTKTTDSSGNYHVTADIKSGSITESKLQPNFLANCRTYANNAHSDAILAQSYTKGDTELRPGEETDNATYYYQGAKSAEEQAKTYRDQAEAIAGIQIATTEVFGIVKPDGNTIDINNGILSTGIPDSQWSYIQNLYQ